MLLMGVSLLLAGTIGAGPYFSRSARGSETTVVTADAVYSCPEKPKVRTRENAEPVVYEFLQIESDRCLWEFGGTDDEGTTLERNGADVMCVVMAERMVVAGEPGATPAGILMSHLTKKGYKPALVESTVVTIGGRQWRHEVADSTYVPSTQTMVQVPSRGHAWSWLGSAGFGMLLCAGVTADVIANDAELQRLANSLRIVETPKKTRKDR